MLERMIFRAKRTIKRMFTVRVIAKKTQHMLERDLIISHKDHEKFYKAAKVGRRARDSLYKGIGISRVAQKRLYGAAHKASKLMNAAIYEQMKSSDRVNHRSFTERKLLLDLLKSLRFQVQLIHKMVKRERKATASISRAARKTAQNVYNAAALAKRISDQSIRDAKDAAKAHRIELRRRIYEERKAALAKRIARIARRRMIKLREIMRRREAHKKAMNWADRQGHRKEKEVRQRFKKNLNNLTAKALHRIRMIAARKERKDTLRKARRRHNRSKRQIARQSARSMRRAIDRANMAKLSIK